MSDFELGTIATLRSMVEEYDRSEPFDSDKEASDFLDEIISELRPLVRFNDERGSE